MAVTLQESVPNVGPGVYAYLRVNAQKCQVIRPTVGYTLSYVKLFLYHWLQGFPFAPDVVVTIHEVSAYSSYWMYLDATVLASGVIPIVNIANYPGNWNQVNFSQPPYLQKNIEYAIVAYSGGQGPTFHNAVVWCNTWPETTYYHEFGAAHWGDEPFPYNPWNTWFWYYGVDFIFETWGTTVVEPFGAVCNLTASGMLRGIAKNLVAEAGGVATLAADLYMPEVFLRSELHGIGYVIGDLRNVVHELSSWVIAHSNVTGVLSGDTVKLVKLFVSHNFLTSTLSDGAKWCAGTINGNCLMVGLLRVGRTGIHYVTLPIATPPPAVIAAQSYMTGALSLTIGEMRGTSDSVSTVIGALKVTKKLIGTIAAQSDLSDTVLNDLVEELAGVIATQSTVTGSLLSLTWFAGAVVGQSNVTGTLGTDVLLAGQVTAQSYVTGWIGLPGEIRGTITIQSTVSGSLSTSKVFAGTITCTCTVTGWMSLPGEMRGTIDCRCRVWWSKLRKERALIGTIDIQSHVSGALVWHNLEFLIGQIVAQSTVVGALHRRWPDFMVSEVEILPVFTHKTRKGEELILTS